MEYKMGRWTVVPFRLGVCRLGGANRLGPGSFSRSKAVVRQKAVKGRNLRCLSKRWNRGEVDSRTHGELEYEERDYLPDFRLVLDRAAIVVCFGRCSKLSGPSSPGNDAKPVYSSKFSFLHITTNSRIYRIKTSRLWIHQLQKLGWNTPERNPTMSLKAFVFSLWEFV